MDKLLNVAELRAMHKQMEGGEISYSKLVELINQKYTIELVKIKHELKQKHPTTEQIVDAVMEEMDGLTKIIINDHPVPFISIEDVKQILKEKVK